MQCNLAVAEKCLALLGNGAGRKPSHLVRGRSAFTYLSNSVSSRKIWLGRVGFEYRAPLRDIEELQETAAVKQLILERVVGEIAEARPKAILIGTSA